jgi:hypothetical protein
LVKNTRHAFSNLGKTIINITEEGDKMRRSLTKAVMLISAAKIIFDAINKISEKLISISRKQTLK